MATKAKSTPRAPSPTRPITPGREHLKVAEFILRRAQDQAAHKGIDLNVGAFPQYGPDDAPDDDPTRPVRLVAHAVARAADKFPMLRKASRHLEGTESKAGLLSDLTAAAVELYSRNSAQMDTLLRAYLHTLRDTAAAKKATKNTNQNGGTHAS